MMQYQKTVEVQYLDGRKSSISSSTNMAAWVCDCGRIDPLLCRSGKIVSDPDGFRIQCPDCSRNYFVEAGPNNRGSVLKVVEIS